MGLGRVPAVFHGDQSGKVALQHPTSALPLAFAGGGNSAGSLGWNWAHDYELILKQWDGTTVDMQQAGGRWDRYTYSGGVWAPPAGQRATLVMNGDGTWTATTPYGGKINFPSTPYPWPKTARAASLADANNNRITLTYTGNNLTSVLDAFGQRITLTYDGSNRVSAIKDPAGLLTTLSYDGSSNLQAVLHPDGARVTYTYDGNHNPTSIQDPLGKITTLAYDGNAKLYTLTDPTNRLVRTLTYDPANSRNRIVDARGCQKELAGQIVQQEGDYALGLKGN